MGLRIREDYRNISGTEKSAILLMSFGEDQAGKLFALLDDEEIKEIIIRTENSEMNVPKIF